MSRPRSPSHVFRTRGKLMLVPGLARRLRRGAPTPTGPPGPTTTRAASSSCRSSSRASRSSVQRGRLRGQGDQAAAPLHRGLAAGRDGDRRQAGRRGGAARGDEGLRDRHAGDARGDHRAPDPGRLHRARRPRAGRHREGPERDSAARRARADLAGPDRRVGAPAGEDRDRRGLARGVHGRHRQVHPRAPSASSTPSSRTSGSRAPTSGRAPSAAATSSRTARATRAGRARTRAAGS